MLRKQSLPYPSRSQGRFSYTSTLHIAAANLHAKPQHRLLHKFLFISNYRQKYKISIESISVLEAGYLYSDKWLEKQKMDQKNR